MLQDQSPREARSRPQTSLSLPLTLHVTTAPSGIHHGPDFGRRLEEASSVAGRRVLPLSHPRPPPTPPHAASLLLSLPIPLNHHCHTTPSQSPTSHRRILAVRTPSRLSNHAHGGGGGQLLNRRLGDPYRNLIQLAMSVANQSQTEATRSVARRSINFTSADSFIVHDRSSFLPSTFIEVNFSLKQVQFITISNIYFYFWVSKIMRPHIGAAIMVKFFCFPSCLNSELYPFQT